jgi:threonylcarbamoyladenosine tRNA methylthiotransferase CDKAL1
MPVQSGSNKVLKDMKRGHTAEVFSKANESFREKFARFTISTDIIVGFPSESEEDFIQTLDLIKETRPDLINLSRYSARPGTKASKMKQLDVIEVRRRSKIIFELAKKIAHERNKEWIGWNGEVLFDEVSKGIVKGRNFAYKPVVVDEKVRLGQRIQVEITNVTTRGLYGVPLS